MEKNQNDTYIGAFRLADIILVGNFLMNYYQAFYSNKNNEALKGINKSLNKIENTKVLDKICTNLEHITNNPKEE